MELGYEYAGNIPTQSAMELNKRGIQLSHISFPNVKRHFLQWVLNRQMTGASKDLQKLEDKKAEVLKGSYMVEHSSISAIDKKINEVKKYMEWLNAGESFLQTRCIQKEKQPIRLRSGMAAALKKVSDKLFSYREKKTENEDLRRTDIDVPVIATDFSREEIESAKQVVEERVSERENGEVTRMRVLPPTANPIKTHFDNESEDDILRKLESSLQAQNITMTSSVSPLNIDGELARVKDNVFRVIQTREEAAKSVDEARRAREEADKQRMEINQRKQQYIEELTKLTQETQQNIEDCMKERAALTQETDQIKNVVQKESQEVDELGQMLRLLRGGGNDNQIEKGRRAAA